MAQLLYHRFQIGRGLRLVMDMALEIVVLPVAEVDRDEEFYRDLVGFRPEAIQEYPRRAAEPLHRVPAQLAGEGDS
ncbi:hypothetical protein ACFZC3_02115 [Streptomyces sp. NPDC007903]|uniref:hypothetical protein n=1 Tax=Streptomyces sp. NPDC007903 TaxID=3364786 RepID=UPI0036EC370F